MEAMTQARRLFLSYVLGKRKSEVEAEVNASLDQYRQEAERRELSFQEFERTLDAEVEYALINMKKETLNKLNECLQEHENGTYGYCKNCGQEIDEPRLARLLFAVRCRYCESERARYGGNFAIAP